nr:hypothetical protein [Tanacetum cinerariifolium]
MGCLPRSACLGSLSLTQSPNSLVLGEGLEIQDNHLCAIREHLGDNEWSRPMGLKLARENLQSRVKEGDSITNVENASEGQSLHASRPSRLCAQVQSVDDMPFRILGDKIICDLDKTPDLSQQSPQNCPKCGNPVNGHYCQGCAFLRKKFEEDLFASCVENVLSLAWEKILEIELAFEDKHCQPEDILELFQRLQNDVQNIHEELGMYINTPNWDRPIVCYDDDDEDYAIAVTHNIFIKSSVENLVPNPSESEGESEYDMPVCEAFTPFSNILFDYDYDFYSSDDQSFSDEDLSKKIYSNPLFDEEIIPMKIDPNSFNEESHFIKRLLYDNSSPRPLEEFVSENSNAEIKSFSPSPILVEDSDSLMEEIDLSFTLNYPMSSGIEEDVYDSERNVLILDELLTNDPLSHPEKESFHFDIPSFSRLEAFQPSAECPMMIHGKNFLSWMFYFSISIPLDQLNYGGISILGNVKTLAK